MHRIRRGGPPWFWHSLVLNSHLRGRQTLLTSDGGCYIFMIHLIGKINRMKISKSNFAIVFCFIKLTLVYGCCFPGSETQLIDDGVVLWQGLFPHDFNEQDQIERKDVVLVSIKNESEYIGSLESRNKNLKLVFVDPKGKETELWEYLEYGAVEKVTFSESEQILRIYYDRSIMGIRDKNYAVVFHADSKKKKTFLLECGNWNL